MSYLKNILLGADQFINTIFGGDPDETISARAWRNSLHSIKWRIAVYIIDIMFLDMKHCLDSYNNELNRSQLPKEYSNEGMAAK